MGCDTNEACEIPLSSATPPTPIAPALRAAGCTPTTPGQRRTSPVVRSSAECRALQRRSRPRGDDAPLTVGRRFADDDRLAPCHSTASAPTVGRPRFFPRPHQTVSHSPAQTGLCAAPDRRACNGQKPKRPIVTFIAAKPAAISSTAPRWFEEPPPGRVHPRASPDWELARSLFSLQNLSLPAKKKNSRVTRQAPSSGGPALLPTSPVLPRLCPAGRAAGVPSHNQSCESCQLLESPKFRLVRIPGAPARATSSCLICPEHRNT